MRDQRHYAKLETERHKILCVLPSYTGNDYIGALRRLEAIDTSLTKVYIRDGLL